MADLNLDLDYFTHPKTMRLIGLLGRGAEVLPIRLWCWCAKYHAESGELSGYSAQEIESCVGWWGKEGQLVEALVKVGFLERKGKTYLVHDWRNHQGHISALRSRAQKAAHTRWNKLKGEDVGNAPSIAQASSKQCSNDTIPTNHTIPEEPKHSPPKYSFLFESIWDSYPVRSGKKAACRHFTASVKTDQDVSNIQKALANYLASGNVKRGYIKNGSTWFNEWQDWINPSDEMMNGKGKNGNSNPNSQIARAGFKHGPDEIKRLRDFEATLEQRIRDKPV